MRINNPVFFFPQCIFHLQFYNLFLWTQDETKIPTLTMLLHVIDYVKKSEEKTDLLDRLQLATLKFVYSLPGALEMTDDQRRCLVTYLIECATSSGNLQLRRSSNALFERIFAKCGVSGMDRLEWSVWVLAASDTRCASFLTESCIELLASPEKLGQTAPCGSAPLLASAWHCYARRQAPDGGADEAARSVDTFLCSVTCGLMHVHGKGLASFLLASIPADFSLRDPMKSFIRMWSRKGKGKACKSGSVLPLTGLSSKLYGCTQQATSDSAEWMDRWRLQLAEHKDRVDLIQLILCQAISYLPICAKRSADWPIVEAIDSMVNSEEMDDEIKLDFLKHRLTVECFEPLNAADVLGTRIATLVRDVLKRNLHAAATAETYKRKLISCSLVAIELCQHSEQSAAADLNLALSLFDMLALTAGDMDDLLVALVQLKAKCVAWLELVHFLLRAAARLRLSGAGKCIERHTLAQVLTLFIDLHAPAQLRTSVADLISICPEYLDDFQVAKDVLRVCLESETDCTQMCALLLEASPQLCTPLAEWCLQNQHHFRDVNWRVQVVPLYISYCGHGGRPLLDMIHANMSPKLRSLLLDGAQLRQITDGLANWDEFCHAVVANCWSVAECLECARELVVSAGKNAINYHQYVHVGRKCADYVMHLKLSLHAAVALLKSDELTDLDRLQVMSLDFT